MKLKYKKYPNLIKAIANRYKVYNETLDFIEEKRKEGKGEEGEGTKGKEREASKRNRPYAASSKEAGYSDFYYGTFHSYFDFAGKLQFAVWTGHAAGKG